MLKALPALKDEQNFMANSRDTCIYIHTETNT